MHNSTNRIGRVEHVLGLTATQMTPGVPPKSFDHSRRRWQRPDGWRKAGADYRFGAVTSPRYMRLPGPRDARADLIYCETAYPPLKPCARERVPFRSFSPRSPNWVGSGLVESLKNTPSSNITGFVVWDASIGGKWMQLSRSQSQADWIMYNPDTAPYAPLLVASAKAAPP